MPEQGGNMDRIKSAVASAADPAVRRDSTSVPSYLSEAALQASAAQTRQQSAPVATPAKKSRSQHIIDRASGTGAQLSDHSLRAQAIGMGEATSMRSVRENRGHYESMPEHFTTGVFHPTK